MILGALEAGGTKMVMSVGNEACCLSEREEIPTETPEITIPRMIRWFGERHTEALGIGSFGPVDLDPGSKRYGWIMRSPKLFWQNTPLLERMRDGLGIPVLIDTDVNAAALAEYELGAAKGLRSCLYVTVGTGVGGGLVAEGSLVHGLIHPEIGHMLLRAEPEDPAPEGFCPFHKGCLEGLASGPAIEKRWGKNAKELPPEHPAWDLEAAYLAQMCMNIACVVSPQRIILGGGVMQQKHLFPKIRKSFREKLNGYLASDEILLNTDRYITEPGLGIDSGVTGALLLARRAYENIR